jgi:hypothetical protein
MDMISFGHIEAYGCTGEDISVCAADTVPVEERASYAAEQPVHEP